MSVERTDGRGEPLLMLDKVSKRFGGLAAVQDVELNIWPREIISVIGPIILSPVSIAPQQAMFASLAAHSLV